MLRNRIMLQIGVNGYVFIVTNNGYLLMHPNLRPLVCTLSPV